VRPTPGGGCSPRRFLGSSLAFIDGTAVNVALPTLQVSLNATAADSQWVVEAYALLLAALILIGGSLGDRLGEAADLCLRDRAVRGGIRRVRLAQTVGQLHPHAGDPGSGGALLVPKQSGDQSALRSATRSEDDHRDWSGFTAVTSALGPVLGGWLIEHASWRWVFL